MAVPPRRAGGRGTGRREPWSSGHPATKAMGLCKVGQRTSRQGTSRDHSTSLGTYGVRAVTDAQQIAPRRARVFLEREAEIDLTRAREARAVTALHEAMQHTVAVDGKRGGIQLLDGAIREM